MPLKFETGEHFIKPEDDKRVKLSNEDKENVKLLYLSGVSIGEISRMYKVNKRLIQFLLFPDRAEKAKALHKERRLDGRYAPSSEQRRVEMQKHRAHKRELFDVGKLEKREKEPKAQAE